MPTTVTTTMTTTIVATDDFLIEHIYSYQYLLLRIEKHDQRYGNNERTGDEDQRGGLTAIAESEATG